MARPDSRKVWAGATTANAVTRFAYHHAPTPSGCWEWNGGLFKESGYGKFNAGDRTVYAHRYAYALVNGPIPAGLSILHRCDNRRCVNPAHLFVGTQLANMQDMHEKGRARPQGKVPLTADQIEKIRQTPRSLGSTPRLAREFNVTDSHIRRIRRREVS